MPLKKDAERTQVVACAAPGCSKPSRIRGFCRACYWRARRGVEWVSCANESCRYGKHRPGTRCSGNPCRRCGGPKVEGRGRLYCEFCRGIVDDEVMARRMLSRVGQAGVERWAIERGLYPEAVLTRWIVMHGIEVEARVATSSIAIRLGEMHLNFDQLDAVLMDDVHAMERGEGMAFDVE